MKKKINTIGFKVIILTITTTVLTALVIQFFAQRSTETAMTSAHDENALNLLNTVVLNVENQYKSILFHENATLKRRKAELKNIVDIVFGSIEEKFKHYKNNMISEEEAKRSALNLIKSLKYGDGYGYLWVNDTGKPFPKMLMHPTTPELEGTVMDAPGFNCALGIKKNLFVAFVDICEADGSGYVDYRWPKPTREGLTEDRAKISYVKLFREWNWIIGTGVYIDDIKEESQKRFDAVLSELRETLAQVSVAENGYMYIFTEDNKILIHPDLDINSDNSKLINPATGNNILDELKTAAKTPSVPFEYIWAKSGQKNDYKYRKKAYVKHFQPLNWYVASSVYFEDIEMPAKALRNRILFLSILILIVATVLAIILSRNLTKPLQQLTLSAIDIERDGINSAVIPVAGTEETVELGIILNNMISSIKESKKELKRENNYKKKIMDAMPSILLGVDTNGKVTLWNTKAHQASGISPDEAVGQSLDKIFPRMESVMDTVYQAMQERLTLSNVKQSHEEEGGLKYEDITVYPIIAGDVEGAVIRIDDVTEKVKMDEMIIHNEKMLSIGGLAAGMAHEINNPLAGIIQTACVVENRLCDKIDMSANLKAAETAGIDIEGLKTFMAIREVPRLIQAIIDSGKRVSSIVDNMLGFARKEKGQLTSNDLAELIDRAVALASTDYNLKKHYDFKNIEIKKVYGTSLPEILCEAGKIQQVLLNILINGAQAMQKAGTVNPQIIIRTFFEQDKNRARIEIEDNGPGMKDENRKRIFEPFYTTKPVNVGTGLGLSVSYFIITENHGGELSVVSTPGSGSTFIIHLPLDGGKHHN